MKTPLRIGVALSLAISLIIPLRAQQLPLDKDTLQNLIEESDLIISGKVTGTEQPGDGTTRVNLRVKEIFKGATPDGETVTVVVPGGSQNGSPDPVVVKGQPAFQEKEQVIVFLRVIRDYFEVSQGRVGKRAGVGREAQILESGIKKYMAKKPLL